MIHAIRVAMWWHLYKLGLLPHPGSPMAGPDSKTAAPDSELVEETQVKGDTGFPQRVILEILTADNKVAKFIFGPMMAHKLSDDLLRAVAAVKRKDSPPTG